MLKYQREESLMFIGRKEEIRKLKSLLNSDGYKAALLFGRRRVGKTELIKEALRGQDGIIIHCECKKILPSLNLALLEKEVKSLLALPDYVKFADFDDLFNAIFDASKTRKIVFVLDEFSYLPLGGENGVDASLARIIDLRKQDGINLKLIISGSYVDLMQKILDISSPLHGRFDLVEEIHEFDYYDAAKFFPNYSAEEKFIAYSVFGGLPYALSLIDPNLSVIDNIKNQFGVDTSAAILLCQDTIAIESAKVSSLNSVLALIACGKRKFTDLVSVLGKGIRLEYALDKGVKLHFIKKVAPINEENNKKLTFYEFEDNLLRFYCRYVFSSANARSVMGKDLVYQEIIKDDFEKNYLPKSFESVSKEFLIRKNKAGEINPPFFKIGTYSFNDSKARTNVQFDVVTLDKNGYVSYECKYTKERIGLSVLQEEKEQTKESPLPFVKLGFISKTGFDPIVKNEVEGCYSLDDFFAPELDDR